MKISIYSREDIEKLIELKELPDDSLVISFHDPWESKVEFTDYHGKVLTICCMDIESDELGDYSLTEEGFFPEVTEVALAISVAVTFNKDIICQCEHGQSRSAAVAAAVKQFVSGDGIEIFADDRYYPNKMIYRKLLKELMRLKEENK